MKSFKSYLPESFIVELGEAPNDSQSPIFGGNDRPTVPEAIGLDVGDTVLIKGNHDYSGKKGEIVGFDSNHAFVVVKVAGADRSFHASDIQKIEIDDDDEDEELEDLKRNISTIRGF